MERHYSDLLVKLVWFEGLCWSISTSSPDPRLVFSVCDPIEPQNHKPAGVGGTTCCVDPVMCFKGLLTDVTSWWEKLSVLSRWGWWSAVQVTSPQGTSRPSRPTVQLSGAALIQWAGTEVNTGVTDLPPQTRRFCPTAWRLADELAVICVSHILSFSVKLWRLPLNVSWWTTERRDRLIAANMAAACSAAKSKRRPEATARSHTAAEERGGS